MTGEPAEPDWGDPPRRPRLDAAPVLAVDGFEGPLDWLLELARSERIDLRRLSIRALVDAFVAALDEGLAAPRADLARWGDWLGMAAHLALLRSRLLLPADAAEARSAQQEAEALRRRLLEGVAMRHAASWLDRRLQLGRDVFAQCAGENRRPARAGDVVELLRACLVVLRVPELAAEFGPARPQLWRVADATARITRLLKEGVVGDIGLFLPPISPKVYERDLRCRAALASTLVAGLELARCEAIKINQAASGAITVERWHTVTQARVVTVGEGK